MTFEATLEVTSLKDFDLTQLPLIDKLRKLHFATETAVCIERAKLITEYMKQNDGLDKPAEILRAEAVAHYLSNRRALFHDDNLIAGGTTSKPIGAPLYPELLGLTIWPELETISERPVNPQKLSRRDAEICNLEIFPYWMDRSVLEVMRKQFNNPQCLRLMERIVFFIGGKAGCISHCVPGFEAALHRGLDALIDEAGDRLSNEKSQPLNDDRRARIDFYQSVRIALEGINAYAAKLAQRAAELANAESDPARKQNLESMAAVCRHVPAKPARTFREAVNALWLCQVAIHAENINMAMSPGRLDQVLYPFYRRDVEENGLTLKAALELGCCLWLKIADNTNLVPITAEKLWGGAGSTPAVTLGGVDKDGKDAVNDVTYILLKVTELMALRDPSVNARYHYKVNDKRYRQRVCEVIVNTRAIPAFHNDVADIETLVNQGVDEKHARDFGIVGCVELASAGRDYVSSSSIMLNLSAAMEMTLLNGKRFITGDEQIGPESGDPTKFTSFNQFWEAFKEQLAFVIGQAVKLNEYLGVVHQQILPTPLLSAFFEGPMESGRDLIFGGALYNSSGASHVAFPDVCDSLNAIEQGVFEEKRLSMEEMVNAVRTNFAAPYDRYLPYLKNRVAKFGTEHPIALKNAGNLVRFIYETYQGYTNYRGGTYRPAYWTMTTHAGQGRLAGALPSGRKANEVFSSGITPASQAAKSLTEAFNAVADLPAKHIPGGQALNIKYTPMAFGQGSRDYIKRFGELVEAYFRNGGLQVQFNVQDYETLIDAKEHPEKYPEMIVRVSGYSAYFNDLNEAMKNELITRTQYDLFNGNAVSLPTTWEGA
ncbi:MAG: pyruvate formate lyase family protein [Desulfobacteraceae bacterium]|jgi:formate C-acetyltransferase